MEKDHATDRTIAIGDIHGCSAALRKLIAAIDPQSGDTIVTLGDYIDRGPDSRGVIEQILMLRDRCEVVHLLGNHELMLLIAMNHPSEQPWWESVGGKATLQSYRNAEQPKKGKAIVPAEESGSDFQDEIDNEHPSKILNLIPQDHLEFMESSPLAYETETHIFVHANYEANHPISEQTEEVLLWKHLTPNQIPKPHISGKKVIVGHTPQLDGEILDLEHIICIDTFCFGNGWLTALEVDTGQVWQANQIGELRDRS